MGQQSSGFCAQSNNSKLSLSTPPTDGVAVETLDRNLHSQVIFVDRKSLLAFFNKNNITAPKLESGATFEFPNFFYETTLDLNEQEPSEENIKKFLALLCMARKFNFHVPMSEKTTSGKKKIVCAFCEEEIAPHEEIIQTVAGPIHELCKSTPRTIWGMDDIRKQAKQLFNCHFAEVAQYYGIIDDLLIEKYGRGIKMSKYLHQE